MVWSGYVSQFVAGAVLGPLLDRLHVHNEILCYGGRGQPIWVVPLFGGAATLFSAISSLVVKPPFHWGRRLHLKAWHSVAWFVLAYMISSHKTTHRKRRAALLAALFALRLAHLPRGSTLFAVICAAIGCLVEHTLVRLRAFDHLEPDLFQLPYWLPFLYMHASPAILHTWQCHAVR